MKLGIVVAVIFFAALPSRAGTLFSVIGSQIAPTAAGVYAPGQMLSVTVTGIVDLLGHDGVYPTNPDGSLVAPLSATCSGCFTSEYQSYVNPNARGGERRYQ